jgi:hypothetical protein
MRIVVPRPRGRFCTPRLRLLGLSPPAPARAAQQTVDLALDFIDPSIKIMREASKKFETRAKTGPVGDFLRAELGGPVSGSSLSDDHHAAKRATAALIPT